jgi:hypothetical protein
MSAPALLPVRRSRVPAQIRPRRVSRRARAERRAWALALVALGTTGALVVGEVARVWRRGSAPLPAEADDLVLAAEEAARQTVAVAVSGYRASTTAENVLLNLLASFTVAFGLARLSTHRIRNRGTFGPFRNVRLGDSHIHHFVPGIAMAFLAGGAAIVTRDRTLDPWLAVPFGAGVALTLDESALLLRLDDVYFSEEGILSVQITFAALGTVSATALALRMLRRGEARVLVEEAPGVAQTNGAPRAAAPGRAAG